MDTASHSLVLLQQLNMQREFGFLCDCTVAIGDVYFKAHRAVLAAFSNYFKMIFIHQTSECIKIQPTDIQPDIFSYLLHIMYTGKGPKQMVDHSRLEEGIRFLHADYLSHIATEMNQVFSPETVQSSNLYGKEKSAVPSVVINFSERASCWNTCIHTKQCLPNVVFLVLRSSLTEWQCSRRGSLHSYPGPCSPGNQGRDLCRKKA